MRKQILIADSDAASLKYYGFIFGEHRIETANNGDQLIEKFKEKKFDALIVSSHLFGKDGLQVIKEIRTLDKLIKIVMVSSNPDIGVEAMELGCDSFHMKPMFNINKLRESIK